MKLSSVPAPPHGWSTSELRFFRLVEMNRKRVATETAVPLPGSTTPKKRKVEKEQKFYAVQIGFRPGVYMTYDECAKQTTGFKGAVCKTTLVK